MKLKIGGKKKAAPSGDQGNEYHPLTNKNNNEDTPSPPKEQPTVPQKAEGATQDIEAGVEEKDVSFNRSYFIQLCHFYS